MSIITEQQVRNRMAGLAPYLEQVDNAAAIIAENIGAADRHLKSLLEVEFEPVTITMDVDEADNFDIYEPPLNWAKHTFRDLPRFVMRRRPVLSVESFTMQFSEQFSLMAVPKSWLRVHRQHGIINLMPVPDETASVLTAAGLPFLPMATKFWPWPVMPQFIHISYTAGFEDAETCEDLAELRRFLSVQAAVYTIEDIRDAIPSSVSIDGASQTFDSVQQRLEQRMESIGQFVKDFRRRYQPPHMAVI